jgi:hypothetical protein
MSTGPVAPIELLSMRLRAMVVQHAGRAPLTCTFQAGGKLHGVGIASSLYCRTCHQARMWHDVAEAVALASSVEASERLPFDEPDLLERIRWGMDRADDVRAKERSA